MFLCIYILCINILCIYVFIYYVFIYYVFMIIINDRLKSNTSAQITIIDSENCTYSLYKCTDTAYFM